MFMRQKRQLERRSSHIGVALCGRLNMKGHTTFSSRHTFSSAKKRQAYRGWSVVTMNKDLAPGQGLFISFIHSFRVTWAGGIRPFAPVIINWVDNAPLFLWGPTMHPKQLARITNRAPKGDDILDSILIYVESLVNVLNNIKLKSGKNQTLRLTMIIN